ncbi:hypothetical protein ACWIUA_10905, partial [Ursidibacter sp. B-7004-1]
LICEIIAIHANIHLSRDDAREAKKDFLSFENEIGDLNSYFREKSTGKKLNILRKTNYLTFGLMSFLNRYFIQKIKG